MKTAGLRGQENDAARGVTWMSVFNEFACGSDLGTKLLLGERKRGKEVDWYFNNRLWITFCHL